ncbi:MAG: C25 family cysteine peptidase [Planctomycetota bacterium]
MSGRKLSWRIAVTLAGLILAGTAATADTWLEIDQAGVVALTDGAAATRPKVDVQRADLTALRVTAETRGVMLQGRTLPSGEFVELTWPDAAIAGEIGTPALPVIRHLFVAPPGATLSLRWDAGVAVPVGLGELNVTGRVLPVQPPIEKLPGARERAPFMLDELAYAVDADVPAERVGLQQVGIVRGQHLWLLEVRPVAYNPVAGTLTFWPDITIDIEFAGGRLPGTVVEPPSRLRHLVLNPQLIPDVEPGRGGNYLIVVAPAYQSAIASFAAAKQAQGFTVTTWVATSASNTAIKTYIQSLWGTANAPKYLLLVGDTDTIPHWTGGGEGTPATDLPYACMDGTSDWFPDIAYGRFPVRSPEHVQNIVNKTLYYENGAFADPGYLKRAVFMASNDNYTVSEGTHNWVITNYMIPNEIVSDKLYCHTYSATTQQVRNAFNAGRIFGVYSGHGGETSWADGPPFSQSDVQGLTNLNMYPIVYSFACVTGTYTINECFTETWIRQANKAAVAIWGSSVNSYWTEDDVLEKRLFDSIYDENDPVPAELGPVWNDTQLRYLAQMGNNATTRRYFEMYNLMGDPSLRYPSKCSEAGQVRLDAALYACEDLVAITVLDCGPNANPNAVEQITVAVDSTSETGVEHAVLTETGPNTAEFRGSIATSATNSAGVLLVAHGDTITVTYIDANNGQGGYNVPVVASAAVDCQSPAIVGVGVSDITSSGAKVQFTSDEPVKATVYYGLACGQLTGEATSAGFSTAPIVTLSGLAQNTRYYFAVRAEDEAGNPTYDDNGGLCYTFKTLRGPQAVHVFSLDTNPGWTISGGQWAWGKPTGGGGAYGGPDPTAGHTGQNVYGYNLNGDYTNNMPEYHLTTTALDLTGKTEVMLKFWRWLGVERSTYDHAYVRISTNGTNWTTIWSNPDSDIADSSWVYQEFNIAAYASNKPTVYLRWTMGTTDSGWTYCGWNIDDIEVWATIPVQVLVGDVNCDGLVDFGDINPFVLALTNPAAYEQQYPNCPFENRDINGDGRCDFGDINPFVSLLTNP